MTSPEKDPRCWCGGQRGSRVPADADGWGCLDDITHARLDERPDCRCPASTNSGTPCQKRLTDGVHAGGHWFMSDDRWACLQEDHYDPANVLSMTPLVHLDVPCPRAGRGLQERVEPDRYTEHEEEP